MNNYFKDIEIVLGENLLSLDGETVTIYGKDDEDLSYRISKEDSLVRNWEKKSGEESKNYLSPESTVKELVKSDDARTMMEGRLGSSILSSPLLKLLYPLKIKTVLKIARRFGLTESERLMLSEYTYAIHK